VRCSRWRRSVPFWECEAVAAGVFRHADVGAAQQVVSRLSVRAEGTECSVVEARAAAGGECTVKSARAGMHAVFGRTRAGRYGVMAKVLCRSQ